MRDLKKNTVAIWYIPYSNEEVMDGAKHTGEFKKVFGTPVKTRISMCPANAKITEELFGKTETIDMISTSTVLDLTKNTLIFLSQPVDNYSKTYDYSVSAISPSLNCKTYGLKKRV